MNPNNPNSLSLNLSGIRFWLTLLAIVWLLGLVGLGWLVKSFLILAGLLLLAPIVGFFVLRWWFKRNLTQDQCPVCGFAFTGLNQAQIQCPSCGEPLKMEDHHFHRLTPPGTIDVQAIEVAAQAIED